MAVLFANPAEAEHIPPTEVTGNANCNAATGLSEVLRLEGSELADGTYAFDQGTGSVTIDITSDLTSFDWSSTEPIAAIFVKGGNTGNLYDYRPGSATSDTGLIAPSGPQGQTTEISHITFCIPDTTTTTPPTTAPPTTAPPTTAPPTTAPPTTAPPTTAPPTTAPPTTAPPTTVPTEVGALVFVTVEGTCVVDGVKGEGEITISVSVDDAATVVVRNSSGSVVANVSSDAVITVPEGATYTWEATPNEGFEFAEDFVSSDEIEIETCSKDEVKDLEVLPFTGIETDALAVMAAVLSTIGLLVLLATRRVEE